MHDLRLGWKNLCLSRSQLASFGGPVLLDAKTETNVSALPRAAQVRAKSPDKGIDQ